MKSNTIGKNLSIIHRYAISHLDEKFKVYGINHTQADVLLYIKDNDAISQSEINAYFLFNKATITKTLNFLESEGLVIRISDEGDKRKKIISLTAKGENVVPISSKIFRKWDDFLTKELNQEEIKLFNSLSAKMVKTITENEGD